MIKGGIPASKAKERPNLTAIPSAELAKPEVQGNGKQRAILDQLNLK